MRGPRPLTIDKEGPMDRTALEDTLRALISGVPRDATDAKSILAQFAYERQVVEAMTAVDDYVDTLKSSRRRDVEAWDAETVAAFLGYADENAARAMLSRNGIEAVRKVHNPNTGRKKSLYPASEVRDLGRARDIRR